MHNKIKAMLATLGVIVGGSTAVYTFVTYTRVFLGLVNCEATTPSSVIFNPMSTRSLCVNDYLNLGYSFLIATGSRKVKRTLTG